MSWLRTGHPCLVVVPSMEPTAPGARVKTKRLDSRRLSTALRGGELKSIHVPAQQYRELRRLGLFRLLPNRAAESQSTREALTLIFW
jgi:hypothetical protein